MRKIKGLNTTQNRLMAIMFFAFGYLSLPLLFGVYAYYSFGRGYFPPKADLVGMPLAAFLFMWVVCFPVFVALCFSIELMGRWIALLSHKKEMEFKMK